MCKEYGIKHVFVRDSKEASLIKEFSFDTVLVLYDIPRVVDKNIIVSINSINDLRNIPKSSKIELKIDTGMNRNGIVKADLKKALQLIEKKALLINGVFTHFCCADEDNNITNKQEKRFLKIIKIIKKSINYNFRIHCANTHGIFKVDMNKYDLARIGIGAYGYLEFKEKRYLQPILSLYANKISTKMIRKNDHIGYGSRAFISKKDMTISNYDIGYADGFLRLSDKKRSTIQDGRKILGRISMDSFSVAGDDDSICIFNNVIRFAKVHKTINYEILSSLNATIQRYIID